MATGFYTNPIYLEHDTGNHPENADRLRAIDKRLRYSGLLNELEYVYSSPLSHQKIDDKFHRSRALAEPVLRYLKNVHL